jgi:parallel beta-helix repeat protein
MKIAMSLFLGACMVLGSLMLAVPADSGSVEERVLAQIPGGVLRINSNAGFAGNASSGDGTVGAPWIIENWTINGNGTRACIYIGNTTDYFIVRNCSVFNASLDYDNPPNYSAGILCYNVTNGILFNNTANNSANGIVLYNSSCEIIQNNVSANVDCGIQAVYSANWSAINNTLYDNFVGLNVTDSGFNMNHAIYHNSFIENDCQAIDILGARFWDSGYPGGGNYWSDYTGVDIYNGPDQNSVGPDGIGDTDYPVGAVTNDRYPLMEQYHGQSFTETVLPYALSWHPEGANISISEVIRIQWNESMNWTSVESGFSYTNGTDVWTGLDGSWFHIPGTFNSTFAPAQPFEFGTKYTVTISCNVTDFIGNPLDQNHSGTGGEWPEDVLVWNFTTVAQDLTPPWAANYTPVGTNVPINAVIRINWTETMNWTSVDDSFTYTDGVTNWTTQNGTWAHTAGNISTFTPNLPFAFETKYWVRVNCTATDMVGNALDQNRSGTGGEWPKDVLLWNFTTDDRAPFVISTVPANGQVDVNPNQPLKITFSERMNVSSVETGFSYTNGTDTWGDPDGLSYWNAAMTEFTYAPAEPLPLNQSFTATLKGSMVRDTGGKTLEGDFVWSFRTWLDPPAPHIVDTYPPNGAFNVNVNTYINIAFDSEMDTDSLVGAFSYTDGLRVWTLANGTIDWFSGNTLLSFQPIEKLRFGATYTVRVTSNATSIFGKRLDGNGNGIPDISDDYVFAFRTTAEPPMVLTFYPPANQMNVPVSLAALYINFSKPMDITSVTNAVSIYPVVAFMPAFYSAGMNMTLLLSAQLLEATQYRVTVLGTATDLSGIKLDGNSDGWAGDKFVFSFFTTGIVQPPKPVVVSVFPTDNSTIPIEPFFVSVTFNVEMNRTSVQNAFRFRNATDDNINGTFLWHTSGKIFRFTPSETLAYNTTYTAVLLGTAKDKTGVPIGNATTWQFITEAEVQPASLMDWLIYGAIIFLVLMVVILFMANRSLRRELKRTRVKLKRLKRDMGVKDDEKPDAPSEKVEAAEDEVPVEEMPREPASESENMEN